MLTLTCFVRRPHEDARPLSLVTYADDGTLRPAPRPSDLQSGAVAWLVDRYKEIDQRFGALLYDFLLPERKKE